MAVGALVARWLFVGQLLAAGAAVAALAKSNSGHFNFTWPTKRAAEVDGDVILGGLMMVHERQENITCGPIMTQGGVQALETMLYTIDRINPLLDNWTGFTLGAHILDDCDKDTYGLEQAVAFIKGFSAAFRLICPPICLLQELQRSMRSMR